MDPGCRGEPAFDDRLGDQPPEQWAELVRQRRRWFWGEGYPLVRMLQRFLLEAPELAEGLGYADSESLFREGYGLDLVLAEGDSQGSVELPGVLHARLCSCCGGAFSARRRDARYCSSTCRSRVSRQRRRLDQES
jgi:predicted nucleic acid-binding Zn ribbon protein